MIGSTLGHYTIDAAIGQGGMGTVYRARDTRLGRTVALKVLTPKAPDDAGLSGRLLREARAASALNHPNIVTIHEIEHADEADFIVMEHVDGEPLHRLIPQGGLPIPQVLDYACQIAGALATAHDAGITHRDVKPGNLMVTRGGQVKILDFGLARHAPQPLGPQTPTQTVEPSAALTGVAMGTVGYMAPEQIEGKAGDARSDVFAFGVVLFELLTGRRPFTGDTTWAVVAATMRAELPDIAALRPHTPPGLVRVVTRCLARRPEDRYPSARALADDLAAERARLAPSAARAGRWIWWTVAAALLVAAISAAALAWWWIGESRRQWVRQEALPEIDRLSDQGDVHAAFLLARRAREIAPDDSQLAQTWANIAQAISVKSDPPGAEVAIVGYLKKDAEWISLGTTPIERVFIPFCQLRWRVTREGFETLETASEFSPDVRFRLTPAGQAPQGMVLVPQGGVELDTESIQLPDYWIDVHEVTNRQFKAFVDRGGYRLRDFWKEPFVKDGRTLSWEEAIAGFSDATGRPGPSTWELGTYPDGQEDFPVHGVSWYEAAAYSEFAGKRLPTIYHWYRASGAFGLFSDILESSNFSARGPVRVGSSGGLGPFGTYDMAGNVREWCWNEASRGFRFTLGGAWSDATYQFRDEDAQSPFDRGPGLGFRCVLQKEPPAAQLVRAIETVERDPSAIAPVADEVYEVYRRLYEYDPIPLEADVEDVDDSSSHWRRERLSFRAGYGDVRVPAYLFLPRKAAPPYQTVVFFPGADAIMSSSSRTMWLRWVEFIVRSGRALIYPVYAGTYERRLKGPRGPNVLRDVSIQRGKDLRRAVDYLVSRTDIDAERLAFYGLSLGAQLGPVYLAIEPRFKTGILFAGGFETWEIPAETDPVHYAPRVRVPVLMVNGRDDFDLPLETAQRPLFEALGTPPPQKQHVILDGGHLPSRSVDAMREMLDWLDRHLGPVGTR